MYRSRHSLHATRGGDGELYFKVGGVNGQQINNHLAHGYICDCETTFVLQKDAEAREVSVGIQVVRFT